MADYVQVFFGTDQPVDRVVAALSAATGAELAPTDLDYADYTGRSGKTMFDLETSHSYVDDMDIPFERMPFVLTVRGEREDDAEHVAIAQRLFGMLSGEPGYKPVYLVRGVTRVLAASAS